MNQSIKKILIIAMLLVLSILIFASMQHQRSEKPETEIAAADEQQPPIIEFFPYLDFTIEQSKPFDRFYAVDFQHLDLHISASDRESMIETLSEVVKYVRGLEKREETDSTHEVTIMMTEPKSETIHRYITPSEFKHIALMLHDSKFPELTSIFDHIVDMMRDHEFEMDP